VWQMYAIVGLLFLGLASLLFWLCWRAGIR
jgi:hypothetical protein